MKCSETHGLLIDTYSKTLESSGNTVAKVVTYILY